MLAKEIDRFVKEIIHKISVDKRICKENCFRKLVSLGELIDRLIIVNIKLFTLKNDVVKQKDSVEFKARAATEDIKLVEERARLKKCIDEKVLAYIAGVDKFNPEVKKY